jgi:hypothetical protein
MPFLMIDAVHCQSVSAAADRVAGDTNGFEFDIKGLFDNVDHELLLRALRKHVTQTWAPVYIERWLEAQMARYN